MTSRAAILPGTHTQDIYWQLLGQMSRAGLNVAAHFEDAARLAQVIQQHGHRSQQAVELAAQIGLDPRWLPHQREGPGA